jgi:hypothetical protein
LCAVQEQRTLPLQAQVRKIVYLIAYLNNYN